MRTNFLVCLKIYLKKNQKFSFSLLVIVVRQYYDYRKNTNVENVKGLIEMKNHFFNLLHKKKFFFKWRQLSEYLTRVFM